MRFLGSDQPEVYIVSPGLRGKDSKLTGRMEDDAILLQVFDRIGLSNWRMCNVIGKPFFGSFTPEMVKEHSDEVLRDIRRKKPACIIVLGNAAAALFEGKSEYKNIPVNVVYHPSYVARKGGLNSPAFDQYATQFNVAVNGSSSGSGYELEHIIVDTPAGWKKALRHLEKHEVLAYDTETNAKMKYSEDCRIIGMGVASRKRAYYMVPSAFGDDNETNFQPVVDLLLSRKEVLVYNAPFEHGVLWSTHKVKFENFFDVATLARVRSIVAPLKVVASSELGVTNWADTVKEFDSFIHACLACLRVKSSGNLKEKEIAALKAGWDSFFEAAARYKVGAALKETFDELSGHATPEEMNFLRKGLLRQAKVGFKKVYYELIPVSVVGKYCCIDAHSLFALRDSLWGKMDEQEQNGFQFYHEQTLFCCELERNSSVWDEKKASEIEAVYDRILLLSMKGLLLSDRVKEQLGLTDRQVSEILGCEDLDYLTKEFLNPFASNRGNVSKEILQHAIRTFPMGLAIAFHEFTADPQSLPMRRISARMKKAKPLLEKEARKLSRKEGAKPYEDIIEGLVSKKEAELTKECFEYVLQEAQKDDSELDDDTLDLLNEVMHEFSSDPSLGDEPVSAMLNALPYMGVDLKRHETFEAYPEIIPLILLRYYKKVRKSLNTYIHGNKLGRGNIWVCRRKSSGDLIRMAPYEEGHEFYAFQTDFFPNSAETRRWRSGFHTIPGMCELRDIQTTRFNNGFVTHVDFSQMEIRVMAYLAQCKGLLDQFADESVDVHRVIASKMLRKEQSKISKAERRYAKTGTFSVLYGATPYRLAMMNMKGNVEAAEKMFTEFFDAFPEIKAWIDERHLEVLRHGYVRTVSGNKLYIPIPVKLDSLDEVDMLDRETRSLVRGALRKAQNYPIQGSASDIAAISGWRSLQRLRALGVKCFPSNFQHDAHITDVCGPDLFMYLYHAKKNLEGIPRELFGIPAKVDMEFGVRDNTAGEIGGLKLHDKKGRHASFSFHIREEEMEEIIDRIRMSWKIEKMDSVHSEKEEVSYNELFLARRAFSLSIGKTYTKTKFEMEVSLR